MSKSSCRSYILRHISNMKDGEVFTTRDCLKYGKRSIVDSVLFKLVKDETIYRLARGVFTRWTGNFNFPTFFQMAVIKAKAFGKKLLVHGADTAAKYKLIPKGNEDPTYYVDGSSSAFLYRGQYIQLKKACKKRLQLPDDKAGLALRAIWHMGKDKVDELVLQKIASLWSPRAEIEKIYRGKAWMTGWIGDLFQTESYFGPFGFAPTPPSVNPKMQEFLDYLKYIKDNDITPMDDPGLDGNYCVVEFDTPP